MKYDQEPSSFNRALCAFLFCRKSDHTVVAPRGARGPAEVKTPVSRLAPTPSGYIHLGNLMNFTITWALTRRLGGSLWLRMDDVDSQRTRPEYKQDLFDTLKWLGFDWDGVLPEQSQRSNVYWGWLQNLPHYACGCTRKSLDERACHCRELGLEFVAGATQVRLRALNPKDDMVLWRKENLAAYQLASVVDDVEAKMSLIVRGEDLRESTQVQRIIAQLAGSSGDSFLQATILHHPLLVNEQGEKLAKSKHDISLKAMRDSGMTVAEVFQKLGGMMKLEGKFETLQDFLAIDWQKRLGP